MMAIPIHPTRETYLQLDRAYDYFNEYLFEDLLPPCVITLQRRKRAYGYFWGDTWADSSKTYVSDEIVLNPEYFVERPLEDILSTLVHEMCHLQQHHFGEPSRNGYHNKEWAGMMEAVGLIASADGKPDGKRTGQKMSHYIDAAGVFEKACGEFLLSGFAIPWHAVLSEKADKKSTSDKTKYCCPQQCFSAWAKPDIKIICGECGEFMDAQD